MISTIPIGSVPTDRRSRELRDLRISVTDRCNHRCRYCMPREHFDSEHRYLPRAEILTFEEIARLASIFVALGVQKIRLTGGEPLLRTEIANLLSMLRKSGAKDIALTTNGSLLAEHAEALAEAGLSRVTVSLDCLDDAVFRAMNDVRFPVSRVLDGIAAAAAAGLGPIKMNAVIRRGVNDDGVLDLVRYARDHGHILRFIEFMDVGNTNAWVLPEVVPAHELLAQIHDRFPLEALHSSYPGEVARRYRYLDGGGELGLITSVSQPFCGDCTRARLSADGKLYTCLFAAEGTDLREMLRRSDDDELLRQHIASMWARRDDRYSELRANQGARPEAPEMSYIGG